MLVQQGLQLAYIQVIITASRWNLGFGSCSWTDPQAIRYLGRRSGTSYRWRVANVAIARAPPDADVVMLIGQMSCCWDDGRRRRPSIANNDNAWGSCKVIKGFLTWHVLLNAICRLSVVLETSGWTRRIYLGAVILGDPDVPYPSGRGGASNIEIHFVAFFFRWCIQNH